MKKIILILSAIFATGKMFSQVEYKNIKNDSIIYNIALYSELYNIYKIGLFEAKEDSTLLVLAYYPWKDVFDTHKIHRVSLYNDGIGILKGLIKYTNDSIQREIYINELMNLYDTWYKYADIINAKINIPYSKTLILSEKAKSYVELYRTEITDINVYDIPFVNMYNYIIDALDESENQEEVHYLLVDKLMRISTQRLKNNWKQYQEQYMRDFDVFDNRMQLLLAHVTDTVIVNNINYLYTEHSKAFNQNSAELVVTTGDCSSMEDAFSQQITDRASDEKYLNQVIRKMKGCPVSDVYIKALENYTHLFSTVTTENIDDVLSKRRLLVNAYLKREYYNKAIDQIKYMLSIEKNNIEKANLYYLWGNILERQGNNQASAFRYKNAVSLNPEFGNAYYRLAIMYSKNKFISDDLKDSYKYLLCIDKLEKAKGCIQKYENSNTLGKYNNASVSDINNYIASFKSMCPNQAEAFMLGSEFSTIGKRFTFPGGVMKGETTIIRFY